MTNSSRSADSSDVSVGGVMIFCEDIKSLTTFYRDVVGLTPDDPQPFAANRFFRFKSSDGAALCLHSGTKPNGGRQKLMLQTENIEGLVERVRAFNRRIRKPTPEESGSVVFDFRDPEGNRIQVYGNAKP